MKKLLFILSIAFCGIANAQNLIPNGDFEQYSSCPTNQSQLNKALFWLNPSGGTPDYFNQCSTFSFISVPKNVWGFQMAHSGVGYSGIYIWTDTLNVREYIETPLTSALIASTFYHFEMFVNLGNHCKYTTNEISVYFSDTSITGIPNYYPLPLNPQINNISGNNFDTLNWISVTGDYFATGGETYLIIGNFKNDSATNAIVINNSSTYPDVYCFIDDVSLSISTRINEHNENLKVNIYPNPATNKLTIDSPKAILEILNIQGQSIIQQQIQQGKTDIDISGLAKGVYILRLCSNDKTEVTRIVKE
jgi:OOP family OmpA-OmpF porin